MHDHGFPRRHILKAEQDVRQEGNYHEQVDLLAMRVGDAVPDCTTEAGRAEMHRTGLLHQFQVSFLMEHMPQLS
jgi:hypothetical protein